MVKKVKVTAPKKTSKATKKPVAKKSSKNICTDPFCGFGSGLDNFFDSFADNIFSMPSIFKKDFDSDFKVPQINLSETKDKYKIKAEIPGVKQGDIEVEYSDGMLAISAKKDHEKEESGESFYRKECSYGSFYKTIALPDDIKESAMKAEYKNGILNIEIGKNGKSSSKPKKKIKVK